MNKLMILMAAFILMTATNVFARGFINNQDRYPSIGLSLGASKLEGDITTKTSPTPVIQSSDLEMQDVTLDVRFPVSHQITLFGEFSYFSQELSTDSPGPFLGEESDLDGFGFRIGGRYYFSR